jgi:hypothetical protein
MDAPRLSFIAPLGFFFAFNSLLAFFLMMLVVLLVVVHEFLVTIGKTRPGL